MKSAKLKLFSILLACVLLLIIATFGIKPRAETHTANFDAEVNTVLVGRDSETLYNLNIGLKVLYDADADLYRVTATAEWKRAGYFTKSERCAEDMCADYIVLRWGGDGALYADSENVYGEYRNGKQINFLTKSYDRGGRFVLQFNEKQKRSQMSFATAEFSLKKAGPNVGRETNVIMTYVHTYAELKKTVKIVFGRIASPNNISYSKSEDEWQIEINVSVIKY